jgi:hypothetical protein
MIAGDNVGQHHHPSPGRCLEAQIASACRLSEPFDGGRSADILRAALAEENSSNGSLADAMRRRFEPLGGVELALPPRGPLREPPDFK